MFFKNELKGNPEGNGSRMLVVDQQQITQWEGGGEVCRRREQCTNDYGTNWSQRGSEPDILYLECKLSCILSNMERRCEGKGRII